MSMNHFTTHFPQDWQLLKYGINRRKSGYAECNLRNLLCSATAISNKKRQGTSFSLDKTIIGAIIHQELDAPEVVPLSFRLQFTLDSLPSNGDSIPLVANRIRVP
jgi:hypothetical protein